MTGVDRPWEYPTWEAVYRDQAAHARGMAAEQSGLAGEYAADPWMRTGFELGADYWRNEAALYQRLAENEYWFPSEPPAASDLWAKP